MSDIWNIPPAESVNPPEEPLAEPTTEETVVLESTEPTPEPAHSADPASAESVAQPETPIQPDPAVEPAPAPQPVAQPAPVAVSPVQAPYQQPPMNGWSSDGGYRYVPPRGVQPSVSPYGQYSTAPMGSYAPPSTTPPVTPGSKPPKKHNGGVVVLALVAAISVLGCIVLGAYVLLGGKSGSLSTTGSTQSGDGNAEENSTQPTERSDAPSLGITAWDNDDGGLATKEIVRRNYASTVLLTAYSKTNNYYFGQSDLQEAGVSTGIIMSADGYIITNRHCVVNESTGKPYDQVNVTLYGGEVYENAQVIGADSATDLAVIRIEATDLTPAQFGDSSELEVGDRVVALGNAAGLEWSASEGIVSALARDVYEDTGYAIQCLQVDASINPGNSGGPLLNNQGLVIGINSAKIAATDYEGIGFSIPINEAKVIVDSLAKYGYVKGRVALGITGQSINANNYSGFMIMEIQDGSSLIGTDAQVGDLIVAVDDEEVSDFGTLRAALAKHQVGDTVELELLHSDRRTGNVSSYTVSVVLKEQTN